MTDFNKDIQYRLESYLDKIARMALNGYIKNANTPEEMKSKYDGAITKVKFIKSEHDEGDPQDYISNRDTCFSRSDYELIIKLSNGREEKFTSTIQIPYMMNNGSFIVDGKLRIATNNLDLTYDCSYNPESKKFQLNNTAFYIKDGNVLASTMEMGSSHSVRINSQNDLNKLGIELKFTDDQLLKLYYLLDVKFEDQSSFPKSLTYDFLVKLPNVKGIDTRRDSVANIRISSISDSLIEYLNEWNNGQGPKAKILGTIKQGLFYPGKGKNPSFAIGSIFTYVMRFFRQASNSGIDIASVVNPMVFDQLYNKIKMPKFLPYTMQFSDIIDAPNTPENGNVNIINELNLCIFHDDTTGVGIYCYQYPYGDKVGIKYNEYINQLVLRNEEWDYANNKLKDPFKNRYKVKYHTYTIELNANELGKVKYIEPKVDDKFSISSRTIPFLNSSDSVRIAMAAGMAKQSVELEHPEDPLIASGNTEVDAESSTMTTYASNNGIIEEKNGVLGVKYDDGVFQAFPEDISGMNHITISHKNLVNPGDRVVKGQKLTTATTADGSYKLGINARCFYLNYCGLTYEDGIVVSQSFADKLAHWTIHDVVVDIYYGDIISNIAKLGDVVSSGDELVKSTSNPVHLEGKDIDETTSKKERDKIIGSLTNVTKVPSNIDNGVVISASYELNPEWAKRNKFKYDPDNHEVITEFVNSINYPDDTAKSNIERVPKQYRNQRLGRTLKWGYQNKKGQSVIGVIRFKIAVRRPLIIGDKLCNRYGSKGMVSCIIPDDCRPYFIDDNNEKQYADLVVNPASIISRKNSSQLNEALLSRAVHKIYKMAKDASSDEELNKVLELIKDIYGNQHSDLTLDGLKAMRDSGLTAFKIFVGTFHENSYEYVMKIAEKLGVGEVEEVYAPSVSIHENKDYASKNTGLEVRCIEDSDGNIDDSLRFSDGSDYELGWLDQPLVIGDNYYYKLYHSAVWSGSVTPTRDNAKSTILGKGKIRRAGQAIGEYENWMLQATGASELYQDPVRSPGFETSQYEFVNALLRGGYELN